MPAFATGWTRRRFALAGLGVVACGGERIDTRGMRRRGEPVQWRHASHDGAPGLGPLEQIPAELRWAFGPEGFAPLPEPGPSDWRTAHPEPPQGVGEFVLSEPNRATSPRTTIVVAPLGALDDAEPDLAVVREYLACFFDLACELAPPLGLALDGFDPRQHDGHRQLRTGAILDALEPQVPAHAYAVLAVTREDLYPGEGWNFVFGQARLHARTGVQSLARYDPRFDGGPPSPALARERGLKVLSHEVGHMFGIAHCAHHACVMNGINHLAELDRSPVHLCRVCLRKLTLVVDGLDPARRYAQLGQFYGAHGLGEARAWVDARLAARG